MNFSISLNSLIIDLEHCYLSLRQRFASFTRHSIRNMAVINRRKIGSVLQLLLFPFYRCKYFSSCFPVQIVCSREPQSVICKRQVYVSLRAAATRTAITGICQDRQALAPSVGRFWRLILLINNTCLWVTKLILRRLSVVRSRRQALLRSTTVPVITSFSDNRRQHLRLSSDTGVNKLQLFRTR